MATETRRDYPATVLDARQSAHLRPHDSVINALSETECVWCQGLLRLILQHLQESIPALGSEVLN